MSDRLLSLTAADFDVQTFRSGGKGGQNQNKRDTGVRIVHRASGATGESREERSQLQNKRTAFRRLAESRKFKAWLRMEVAARLKGFADAAALVEKQMSPENLRVETFDPTETK